MDGARSFYGLVRKSKAVLISGRESRVTEDGLGAADSGDGAEVGQGEAVKPLGVVAANGA